MSDSAYTFRLIPHLLVPAGLVALGIVCQYTGLDEWLIQPFYDEGSQAWTYASHWVTSDLLHTGGKFFVVCIEVALLGALLLSPFLELLSEHKWDVLYTLLGSLSGIGLVAILKYSTHIYSPCKLIQYGGTRPYIRLFDHVLPGLPIGHAFPAGHASAGFGLVSLYFLLAAYGSKWRHAALSFALALGFIFGLAQQARGKHFFSHDLFTLAVCWTSALLVLYAMRIPNRIKFQDAM